MDKAAIKDGLTKLLEQEKLIDANKSARELIKAFNELRKGEEREEPAEGEETTPNKEDEEIEELISAFNKRRKEEVENAKAQQHKNLEDKKAVLAELKNLVENEENISKAFNSISEIHAKWKEAGQIPAAEAEEMQAEYNRLNELFFYNINIYKELKDYDLKKNYSLKNQVIHDMQELANEKSIRKTQKQLQILQDKWAEIGPTFREAWEDQKEQYWTALRAVLDKVRDHYKSLREQNTNRVADKKKLVEEYAEFVKELPADKKGWDQATKTSDDFFDRWKGIGFTPAKDTDAVWEEFNGLRKKFFDGRKAFFAKVNEGAKVNADKKRQLIEKAEALKDSEDRDEAKFQLIKLQKQWKEVGYAGKFADQKLWKQFRAACDHFFNKLDAEREEADKENQANLKVKNGLLKELTALKLDKDAKTALKQVSEKCKEINDAGPAPSKEWSAFNKSFLDAAKKHLDNIKGQEFAVERIWLSIRMGAAEGARDPESIYKRERDRLRKEKNQLAAEVAKYETNMGFFSKGAEALLAQAQEKVDASKARIEQIDQLMRHIP